MKRCDTTEKVANYKRKLITFRYQFTFIINNYLEPIIFFNIGLTDAIFINGHTYETKLTIQSAYNPEYNDITSFVIVVLFFLSNEYT